MIQLNRRRKSGKGDFAVSANMAYTHDKWTWEPSKQLKQQLIIREERERMMDSTRIPINWADMEDDFDKDTHSLVILHLPMNYLSVLVHCMETAWR